MTVLLHIGYHKTASTWLQTHLFRPDAGFKLIRKKQIDSPPREIIRMRPLEFDPRAVRAQFEPKLRKAREQGLLPVVSNERLSGHPNSGGYDNKEIADRLAAVFPEGKVLAVIREQRSIILSAYKQYVLAGGPCTFSRWVETPVDPAMRLPGFDFRFFEYDHLIRHYQTLFGAGSLLVLPYEGLVRDPLAFVESIGFFVERPVGEPLLASLPFGSKLHRTPSATLVEATRWANWLARRSPQHPAPLVDSPRLFRRAQKLARRYATNTLVQQRRAERSEATLRQSVEDAVGDRYRESNRVTAELTGLDLAGYGWTM